MAIGILMIGIVAVLLSLNVAATIAILRDSISEPTQRRVQLLLVWLLPAIGAIIVLGVHRSSEEASRKYRKRRRTPDDIEDFETGLSAEGGGGDGGGD